MTPKDFILTLAGREDVPFVLAMRTSLNDCGGAKCAVVVGCMDDAALAAFTALAPSGVEFKRVSDDRTEALRVLSELVPDDARVLVTTPKVWFDESPRSLLLEIDGGETYDGGPFEAGFTSRSRLVSWLDGNALSVAFNRVPKPWEAGKALAWDYSGASVTMHHVLVAEADIAAPLTFNLLRQRYQKFAEVTLNLAGICQRATPDWQAAPGPLEWLGADHVLFTLDRHSLPLYDVPQAPVKLGETIMYVPANLPGASPFVAASQVALPVDAVSPEADFVDVETATLEALDKVLSGNRHHTRAVHAFVSSLLEQGRQEDVLSTTEHHLDSYPDDEVVRSVRNAAQRGVLKTLTDVSEVYDTRNTSRDYKVSVIISTYASEAFMEECLSDLYAQTIADLLEIIIVDANSPEDERSIVWRYQEQHDNICYVRTPERIGIYKAWNLAISHARGKYMTPFSTNDRLASNAYEILSATLDATPDTMLVFGNSKLTDTPHETFDNHTPSERGAEWVWPDYSFEYNLASCTVGPHPMWRSEVMDTFGFFDERYAALSDQDFFMRIGRKVPLTHINAFTGLAWLSESALSDESKTQQELGQIRRRFLHYHARDMVELVVFSNFVNQLEPLLATGNLAAAKALLAPVRHRLPQNDLVQQLEAVLFK